MSTWACFVFTSAVTKHARHNEDFFGARVDIETWKSRAGVDLDDLCLGSVCALPQVALPDPAADLIGWDVAPMQADDPPHIDILWFHVSRGLLVGGAKISAVTDDDRAIRAGQ